MKNLAAKQPFAWLVRSLLLFTLQIGFFSVQAAPSPYTWDANTLFLFHFDEAAGASAATNSGSLEGNVYSVNMTPPAARPQWLPLF